MTKFRAVEAKVHELEEKVKEQQAQFDTTVQGNAIHIMLTFTEPIIMINRTNFISCKGLD